MPQYLEETEYPGSVPKFAMMFSRKKGEPPAVIAPIVDMDQAQYVHLRLESLGFQASRPIPIYSPADLDRVQGSESHSIPTEPGIVHKPGCIFSASNHPGDCYLRDDAARGGNGSTSGSGGGGSAGGPSGSYGSNTVGGGGSAGGAGRS